MIPAAFAYQRASSVDEASRLLAQNEDAKILAGGHSLIPLMRLRLAQPGTLVDINGLDRELGYIRRDNGTLRIGALTRHYQIEESADVKRSVPLLAEVAAEVGDTQVRTMGTIGGVLAHADPAGDLRRPGAHAGRDDHDQQTHHCGTRLLPRPVHDAARGRRAGHRGGVSGGGGTAQVHEVPPPHVRLGDRRRRRPEAGQRPVADRHHQRGPDAGPRQWRRTGAGVRRVAAEAAKQATQGLDPASDLRGSAEYKLHLAQVLTQRAIEGAT